MKGRREFIVMVVFTRTKLLSTLCQLLRGSGASKTFLVSDLTLEMKKIELSKLCCDCVSHISLSKQTIASIVEKAVVPPT